MNRIATITACVLLGGAGLVWSIPGRVVSPDSGQPPAPPSTIVISLDDPGSTAAIKFLALYADGNAREAAKFAQRLRDNPTRGEFSGGAAAGAAWRETTQDILRASQEGLARKIEAIDQNEEGWAAAADYTASAADGWREAAAALTKLSAKSRK
jgi:hypothetical protein